MFLNKRNKCKYFLFFICTFSLFILSGCSNKPVIQFDGRTLYYDEKEYIVEPLVQATEVGEYIGNAKGNNNLKVYEVKGQNPNEWLTIQSEGTLYAYKEKNVHKMVIEDFNIKTINVINPMGYKRETSITDLNIIKRIVEQVSKSKGGTLPQSTKKTRLLECISPNYKGLAYVLMYEEDSNGKRYLYDGLQEKAYEINDLLDKYIQ